MNTCDDAKVIEIIEFIKANKNSESSIIDEVVEAMERSEILKNFHIMECKDGYFKAYVREEDVRRQFKSRTRKGLESKLVKYWREHKEIHTFVDVVKEWSAYRRDSRAISQQTYDRYSTDCKRFFEGTIFGASDIEKIDINILNGFITSTIIEKNLTQKAYSGMRLLLTGAFKYTYNKGWTKIDIELFFRNLQLNPRNFVHKRKQANEEVFTDEEVNAITEYIWQNPDIRRLGVLLAFYTGMRAGEIAGLKHEDIHSNYIDVHRTEIRYKKDGKYVYEVRDDAKTEAGNRQIIVTDKVTKILNAICQLSQSKEYVFVQDGKRIRGKTFTNQLERICKKLHIKKRSLHKARKTFATNMLNANVPESLIIQQMGHADIRVTRGNYFRNNVALDKAVGLIGDALNY